jgi:hypothetical protein
MLTVAVKRTTKGKIYLMIIRNYVGKVTKYSSNIINFAAKFRHNGKDRE